MHASAIFFSHPFPFLGWPISLILILSMDSKLATCLKKIVWWALQNSVWCSDGTWVASLHGIAISLFSLCVTQM